MMDDRVMALLAEIRDELHALRLAAERPRGAALSQADRARLETLLPAISASVGNYVFTGRELLEHAVVADAELRAEIERALGGVNATTARRLGKLLTRADGFAQAGRRVVRVGDCRAGGLWAIEQV